MFRAFFVTVAFLCGLVSAGLVFGWDLGVFDDPAWQADAPGWLGFSAAAFAASWHPWVDRADLRIERRGIR